ncbi:MAG: flavodoxin family protein [Firmicutes bacterium]|nr:flavodoxin family protein [Bacillota bacterium]
MKASIIYHSESGNTKAAAEHIAKGIQEEGLEVKCFSIDEVDEAWGRESKLLIMGCPVYSADVSAKMKAYLEKMPGLEAAGKLGGAFATANFAYGGGDLALHTILTHMMVRGMLVYSGGGAAGKPIIHLGPVVCKQSADCPPELQTDWGRRMARKAKEIFR